MRISSHQMHMQPHKPCPCARSTYQSMYPHSVHTPALYRKRQQSIECHRDESKSNGFWNGNQRPQNRPEDLIFKYVCYVCKPIRIWTGEHVHGWMVCSFIQTFVNIILTSPINTRLIHHNVSYVPSLFFLFILFVNLFNPFWNRTHLKCELNVLQKAHTNGIKSFLLFCTNGTHPKIRKTKTSVQTYFHIS